MNLAELIAEGRDRADDAKGFQQYSDEQFARWLSEAESEAAIRAKLLFDSSTEDLLTFDIAANQAIVELDPVIFAIDSARFTANTGGRGRQLCAVGLDWIQDQCDWQGRSCSRPGYFTHFERSKLRIWETPSVAGVLTLEVYRLPLLALEDDEDEPEIAIEQHMNLIDWVMFRAYGTKDSEESDPQRSADALAKFEASFGTRNSADVMRKHREQRRITTRMV